MTNGQKVVKVALGELGVTEEPWGSNTGPRVDVYTRHAGMHAVPWCGCFVGWVFAIAGVSDSGLASPSTGVTCVRADGMGGLAPPAGKPIPAGSLWDHCGVHIEIVMRDNGDGTVSNIGGNVNQQVSLTRRRISDARIIVPPSVLEGVAEPAVVYGFDDLNLRPQRYGGWPTKSAREAVIAKLPKDIQRRVRRVHADGKTSPFAFEVVNTNRWRFGPWDDKAKRDGLMRTYQAAHKTHALRPFAIGVADQPSGTLTSGDSQT